MIKSHNFSKHSGGKHHGHMKNHEGHPHGHPTEHGHSKTSNASSKGDTGSMGEWGLSAGNAKAPKSALPMSQPNNSLLKEHKLQHVDYAEMVGRSAYTEPGCC